MHNMMVRIRGRAHGTAAGGLPPRTRLRGRPWGMLLWTRLETMRFIGDIASWDVDVDEAARQGGEGAEFCGRRNGRDALGRPLRGQGCSHKGCWCGRSRGPRGAGAATVDEVSGRPQGGNLPPRTTQPEQLLVCPLQTRPRLGCGGRRLR